MNYFIRSENNYWGFGESFTEAAKKANLENGMSLVVDEIFDCAFIDRDNQETTKRYMSQAIEDWRECESQEATKFQLWIVPDSWGLDKVNPIDGSPTFKQIEDYPGDSEEFRQLRFVHCVYHADGSVRIV